MTVAGLGLRWLIRSMELPLRSQNAIDMGASIMLVGAECLAVIWRLLRCETYTISLSWRMT